MPERVAAGLRVDAQAMRPAADPDPRAQPPRARGARVGVSVAYPSLVWRPPSQSVRPSAETPPMSGEPPPGSRHLRTGLPVRREISEIDPSRRFDTYR